MVGPPVEAPPASGLDLLHPFTTAEALAAGIAPGRLRGREFRRLAKGKYVSARRRLDAVLEAEAALLGHPPDAFVTHTTAARLYRMPVPHDTEAHVGVLHGHQRRRRTGVRSHVVASDTAVVEWKGVRVSSPAYVFLQLAEVLSLVELVVQGDYLVRQGCFTPEQLVAVCASSGEDHAGRALLAARLVREGVDSPMETRLRLLLVLAGLPEPKVNYVLLDDNGRVRRRFDLCYPQVRVIVEYDGRQHAEDPAQYDHDRDRREELDEQGWRIVVVTAEGIYRDPERTLRRVTQVLRARGSRDLPPHFRRGWRTHFPGRTGGD
jgi:hypothetical protein